MNPFMSELDTATQRKEAACMGDPELVAVARSGDPSAFAELSKRHSKRVLYKIYRVTKNWHDAEDILQESLMRAFVHLHTFEYKASFSTWFTSIAMNTALMLLRKQKRFPRLAIDGPVDDGAESERPEFRDRRDNPEEYYVQQQGVQVLRQEVLRLPPEWRSVVELQQTGELSANEIAQSLGISQSAVKSRLFRARAVLTASVQKRVRRSHRCSGPHSALRCE